MSNAWTEQMLANFTKGMFKIFLFLKIVKEEHSY